MENVIERVEGVNHEGPGSVRENDEPRALEIRALSKSFGAFVALSSIELDVERGEFVCFLGPSGCGKTTLLRAIAGLDSHDHGSIHQNGRDISRLPVSQRDFGIVFQSYALFPNLNVERNVGYGLPGSGLKRHQRAARVKELLDLVGLQDQAKKYPAQLSGGQQQRVALARAMAPAPGLLLLDEPLSALDAQVRVHLRDQLKQLQRRFGVTTIMVTHDQDEALAIADRVVVMNHGTIEQVGTPEEVFSRPISPFVAGFLGDTNFIAGIVEADQKVRAGGRLLPGLAVENYPVGSAVRLSVRPADIVLSPVPSPHAMQADIKAVTFRGNFYRIELYCTQLEKNLSAEVPRDVWEQLGIGAGNTIGVSLPSSSIIVFPN